MKSLGLIVPDENKAFEILSDIGFYRLGFYLFPFEKKYPAKAGRDHSLRDGISIDTVLRLYYFDFELRLLLLKYISRIEIHLRTTIVNYMSAKHHNKDTWFVDDTIVSPAYVRSFGSIYDVDLYDAISNVSSRLDISKAHGIRSIKTFDNYLTSVRRVRNRCAHAGILFDYAATEALTTQGPVDLSAVPDRTNLRGAIEVIKYLTGIVSVNRLTDLERELRQLIDKSKEDQALYMAIQIASGL